MTKTPEQMAVEWLKEEYGDTSNWTYMGQEMSLDAFYAGYQAAKDEILSKGMQGYITEIRNDAWCTAMQLGQQSQWISVKERLPQESTHCVIRIDDGEYQVAWRENGHWIMFNPCCIYNSQLNNVTHWMPLPAAPKEEADD